MTILLLLDYAQGKVGKEVFISDWGSCRRRSRVMMASRSRKSWMMCLKLSSKICAGTKLVKIFKKT